MSRTVFSIIVFVFLATVSFSTYAFQDAANIPVQHHGRIKPFSAFAQETIQSISGKAYWQGTDATDFILFNLADPQQFLEIAFIRIDHPELKALLGLPVNKNFFSYQQCKPSFDVLTRILQKASEKRNTDVRSTAIEQQAEIVYQRFMLVTQLFDGSLISVIPSAQGSWGSPFNLSGEKSELFKQMIHDLKTKSPGAPASIQQWWLSITPLLENGMQSRIRMESLYYALNPFHYAWILYLTGFIGLLLPMAFFQRAGKFLILTGFLFHTAGLLLRSLVLLRPPVANMYETMVFMDWVLMICAGIFVLIQKRILFLSSGALVSALIMLYARILPIDQSMDVLAPVLRSSYWLTVHVVTIISSYSLFAFAMAVSHRHLFLSVYGKMTPQDDQISAHTINRLLQAGLILLGAGTILGGVWANEAWGRFWGWDPKETWAFITFLGYMVILHLRHSRKLNNFALAISGISGFLLVLMTWYGVNFVLGRGLHSYGSGSGGLIWIIYFLIFESCFLGYVWYNQTLKRREK